MPQLLLQQQHEARGARLVQKDGWLLPEYYVDPLLEYHAVRQKGGIIDLSHDGTALLSGEERTAFLQNLISNDIHLATDKKGIFSTLLTAKGKVLSALYIYSLSDAYLMTMESGLSEKTLQHLMRFRLRSKIKIETPRWGKFLIAGPLATPFLTAFLKRTLPIQEEGSFFFQEVDPILCIRQIQTGEEDYLLFCREESLSEFFTSLLTGGAEWGLSLVGQAALEILRIEAGVPRYGLDIDESTIPIEAGLTERAISYTKGCYPGQEVVARIKTYGHVKRHLMGLLFEGTTLPRLGDRVMKGDQEMGQIRSSTYSPFLKRPIAMAYLRVEVAQSETPLLVLINGVRVAAVVTKLPFYQAGCGRSA